MNPLKRTAQKTKGAQDTWSDRGYRSERGRAMGTLADAQAILGVDLFYRVEDTGQACLAH